MKTTPYKIEDAKGLMAASPIAAAHHLPNANTSEAP